MMLERSDAETLFEDKIIPYLDGSLSPEDVSEFEAFVSTHPEFEQKIKSKQDEIKSLKDHIPMAMVTPQIIESIQGEMRTSVFNLLNEDPVSFIDRVRIKWEEWSRP